MTRRWVAPAALLALYVVLVAFANQKHLWHDELYTFYISQSSSLFLLWQNLRFDLNPPLLYLLARASMRVFGNTAFAVRLPSMIGFFAGSLCLYALVRQRWRSSAYGGMAVLIFWLTAFYYATEARPYGLVLGFFGCAMLAWQRAVELPRSGWTVIALAAAVTGMMLSHFFAVLFLVPFLLAETVRAIRQRRVDWPVAAAFLIPCVVPFFFLRMQGQGVFPDAFRAGVRKMASYYYWTLRDEGWVLLSVFLILLIVGRSSEAERPKFTSSEIAFAASLLSLPVLINAVLMVLQGAFFTRYAAPTLFVYPILFVALLTAWTSPSRFCSSLCCAALAVSIFHHVAKPLPERTSVAGVRPDLPLVAASGLTFLEMDHEESPAMVNRLYYLTDREYAIAYAHATLFEGLADAKAHLPVRAHVEPFREFARSHQSFLVLGTPEYAEDWLLRCLRAQHARLELLGDFPSEYKDTQLFLVTLASNR